MEDSPIMQNHANNSNIINDISNIGVPLRYSIANKENIDYTTGKFI